mgnify:CR=1 FL=1
MSTQADILDEALQRAAAVPRLLVAVDFDGTGSTDSDGTVVSYLWDFGGGATSTDPTPSYVFTADGPQVVSLTVTDDDGAGVADGVLPRTAGRDAGGHGMKPGISSPRRNSDWRSSMRGATATSTC